MYRNGFFGMVGVDTLVLVHIRSFPCTSWEEIRPALLYTLLHSHSNSSLQNPYPLAKRQMDDTTLIIVRGKKVPQLESRDEKSYEKR